MELSTEQLQAYWRDGYVFVPALFTAEEIGVARAEVEALVAPGGRGVIPEADGKTTRSVLNPHLFNAPFDRLCRHEKVIGPVMQIVESPVYYFQSILNVKRAFEGQQWQWHQDYETYKVDDLMAEPRAVNVMIFIDEVNEFNGPFMMVPGSQGHIVAETPVVDASVTPYPHGRYPSLDVMKPVVAEKGITAPKGPPGSVVFMSLLTVHGSGGNMSPWHRSILSLTLNSVENLATGTVRGDSVCHDYTAIEPLPTSALLEAAGA